MPGTRNRRARLSLFVRDFSFLPVFKMGSSVVAPTPLYEPGGTWRYIGGGGKRISSSSADEGCSMRVRTTSQLGIWRLRQASYHV